MTSFSSFSDFITAGHAGFSRASAAFQQDDFGVYIPFSSGVLRRVDGIGTLLEPEGINYAKNSGFSGVVAGVVGSGGGIPGWTFAAAGGTRTIHGVGVFENGLPYVEISWAGTNSSGSAWSPRIGITPDDMPEATQGQTWYSDVYVEIVSTSHGMTLLTQERGAGNSYLGGSGGNAIVSGQWTMNSRTAMSASIQRMELTLGPPTVPNGQTLSARIKLGAPQFTRVSTRRSPIITPEAAIGTRPADALTLNPPRPDRAFDWRVVYGDNSEAIIAASLIGPLAVDPSVLALPVVKSIRAEEA